MGKYLYLWNALYICCFLYAKIRRPKKKKEKKPRNFGKMVAIVGIWIGIGIAFLSRVLTKRSVWTAFGCGVGATSTVLAFWKK